MPVLDGYALAARVRADPRFAALPILALSARPDDAQRARCRASGMDDCLSKPVSNADLLRALRRTTSAPRTDKASGDALQALQFLFPNPQALGAVLGQFVQTTRKDLKELDTLHAAGAWEAFGRMLHRISGSLQLLDQREVAAVLDRARRAGTPPTPDEYADLKVRIDGVVQRVGDWTRQLSSSA
jgi:two-component system sensor histidine kinase EvgS